MKRMQTAQMDTDFFIITKPKTCVYLRLKIRVIRLLFFFGTRMTRMQAARMDTDFFIEIKPKTRVYLRLKIRVIRVLIFS